MSDRPLIGLSCYRERARWGVWHSTADLLPANYVRSVEAAGGTAVLLPVQAEGAGALLRAVDGLIIAGGPDITPGRYGAEPHPQAGPNRPERESWEAALLEAARDAGTPTLGICHGMQLMAVLAGGSLEQHLPDVVGHEEHSPGDDAFGWVSISTRAGSQVRQLVGNHLQVNCHHHQAVVQHPGFEVTARAADGTVEAIEDPERDFWMGVQWHPEFGDDYGLFRGLVQAASA
jgi:putative glutamine amidotransferase